MLLYASASTQSGELSSRRRYSCTRYKPGEQLLPHTQHTRQSASHLYGAAALVRTLFRKYQSETREKWLVRVQSQLSLIDIATHPEPNDVFSIWNSNGSLKLTVFDLPRTSEFKSFHHKA